MVAPSSRFVVLLVAFGGLIAPGAASAQAPIGNLVANLTIPGTIGLVSYAPSGSSAAYSERVGSRIVPLGTRAIVAPNRGTGLFDATTWRCDRLVRRFEVNTTLPDGTHDVDRVSVRTPSCRNRLEVSAPTRTRPGRKVRVTVVDNFRIGGYRARVCAAGPRGRFGCRTIPLRPGQIRASATFVPRRRGWWRLRVKAAGFRASRQLAVGRAPARRRVDRPLPRLLTTGDSTIQGVDGYLADLLARRATAVTQVLAGSGISKPFGDHSWIKSSRIQSSTFKPRLTVVSIGANDAFPMDPPGMADVECCGPRWIAEYRRRARIMMRTWTRFGGHLLWMTLPTPRDPRRVQGFAAVNTAVSRAAQGLPRVRLVRIDTVFTPTGSYSPTLRVRGRDELVRGRDGIHLSARGTEIAAEAAVAQLDRLGWLPRR